MKINLVGNGILSIAITPENELEKLWLDQLFSNPEGVTIVQHKTLQLLDKQLVDTTVISNKRKELI
jgi:hypothetical protein